MNRTKRQQRSRMKARAMNRMRNWFNLKTSKARRLAETLAAMGQE